MREEWINVGFEALREGGIDTVRIDRLAATLQRTKGSFHHHFAGTAGYHHALLERFEEDAMREVSALTEETATLPVPEALGRLATGARFDPALEAGIRGWAEVDSAARVALARVDTARLDALTQIWSRELHDVDRARTAALVPHLVIIGASVAQPTPTTLELGHVFALLTQLVPHVRTSFEE